MDSVGDNYHTETFVDACDKLLEKMRCLSEELDKDYYSTCNGGEDAATTASNLFETGQNGNSKDVSKLSSPKRPTDFTSNIDKITNYRYSFYENSNKISVYVASSATITQAVSFFCGKVISLTKEINFNSWQNITKVLVMSLAMENNSRKQLPRSRLAVTQIQSSSHRVVSFCRILLKEHWHSWTFTVSNQWAYFASQV